MTTQSATIEMPQREAGAEPNHSGDGEFSTVDVGNIDTEFSQLARARTTTRRATF